jgi:multicomponent Na+:H+ antiporter subunit B
VLLGFLAATAIAVARLRDLFAVVMLFGIYSLLSAAIFVTLDAVDVAFTEAAVGAGISTVLMLATLALTARTEKKPSHSALLPLLVVCTTGGALVYGTLDMPRFGDPEAPINLHVAPRYLQESPVEVGLPNVVTSVLASYRGYDTLGEVAVIFTAGAGVLMLLGTGRRRIPRDDDDDNTDKNDSSENHNLILRVVAKILIPFILLFAIYVQFHGDFGPGGGFQAGVIFAAAFILYSLIFGLKISGSVVSLGVLRALSAMGVLLYAGVGVASIIMGGNFLDYNVLAHDPTAGQHLGIMLIELGVGTTVAAVMIMIFFMFARRNS